MTADGDGFTKSRLGLHDPGGFSFALSWAIDARRATFVRAAIPHGKIERGYQGVKFRENLPIW